MDECGDVSYVHLASGELFVYTKQESIEFVELIRDQLSQGIEAYASKVLSYIETFPADVPAEEYMTAFCTYATDAFMVASSQQLEYYAAMSWPQQQWCHTIAGLLDVQLHDTCMLLTKVFVYAYIAKRFGLSYELLSIIDVFLMDLDEADDDVNIDYADDTWLSFSQE